MRTNESLFGSYGVELVLLALAAFLAPIIGGQVAVVAQPLESDIVTAVMGGPELTMTARALVGGIVLVAFASLLLRRRVLQVPNVWHGGWLIGFVALFGASAAFSEFGFISVSAWLSWVVFVGVTYLAVAASGRRKGVRAVLGAMAAGCSLLALKGVVEYLAIMRQEPTHRIFADWNNPNALAGMLLIGLCVALGLTMASSTKAGRLLSGAGATLIGFALALTQSKGGYAAALLAVALLLVLASVWGGVKKAAVAVVPLLLAGLLVVGVQAAAKSVSPSGATNAFARVSQAGAQRDQSVGFRELLWKTSVDLIKQRPLGWGVGTFRYESSRPGLTSQTQMAHQTFLQVGAEGGLQTLAVFLVFGLGWFAQMFVGARAMQADRNVLRASVMAAMVGVVVHGCVESNLYYFGLGFSAFVLLGLGYQLASDGSSPESLPGSIRRMAALLGCGIPLVALIFFASVEARKSLALGQVPEGRERARESFRALPQVAPRDGECWYLAAVYGADTPEERMDWLTAAVEHEPTPSFFRALARTQATAGKGVSALFSLDRALTYDPNNLDALVLKLDLLRTQGDAAKATDVAQKLVGLEQAPYLKVRAIPELVVTEPAYARIFLAGQTGDLKERERLLREALAIYRSYTEVTLPMIKRFASAGVTIPFAGETLDTAKAKMTQARDASESLAKLLASQGKAAEAADVRAQAAAFTAE